MSSQNAPTPAASAATPAASAPTPAAFAPTPSNYAYSSSMSAPTPGVVPNTPGVMDYEDSSRDPYGMFSLTSFLSPSNTDQPILNSDPPDDWILDEKIAPHQTKLRVVMGGSIMPPYLEGKYEGRTAVVVGATRVRENYEQTAFLRFEDDGEERSILTRYIKPVLPRSQDETALVIYGRRRGEVARIRQKPDSQETTEMVVVESIGSAGAAYWECQKDHMCAMAG